MYAQACAIIIQECDIDYFEVAFSQFACEHLFQLLCKHKYITLNTNTCICVVYVRVLSCEHVRLNVDVHKYVCMYVCMYV